MRALNKRTVALIVAAGKGNRFGGKVRKQYYEVYGRPILYYTLKKFQDCHRIDSIVLVVDKSNLSAMQASMADWGMNKVTQIVAGGGERHHSVYNGLQVIPKNIGWVAIHDGVRPLVTPQQIIAVLDAAQQLGAAVLAVTPKDTIKEIHHDLVQATLRRERLIQVQTPQIFARDLIMRAYEHAFATRRFSTDDAALVEQFGFPVRVVFGDHRNIKVTTPEDIILFKAYLQAEQEI